MTPHAAVLELDEVAMTMLLEKRKTFEKVELQKRSRVVMLRTQRVNVEQLQCQQ